MPSTLIPFPGFSDQTERAGAPSLAYSKGPSSGPPLILLHGLTGRRDSFNPVIPALAPHYQLFLLDLPGHGKSGRNRGSYTAACMAQQILRFIGRHFDAPVFAWGQSLGARVLLEAAAQRSEAFAALILEDPPLVKNRPRQRLRPIFRLWLEIQQAELSEESMIARLAQVDGRPPSHQDRYKAQCLIDLDPELLRLAIEDSIIGEDIAESALLRIRCPCLLMRADPAAGGIIDFDLSALDVFKLENWICKMYPQAGHKIHATHPELATAEVLSFLAAC